MSNGDWSVARGPMGIASQWPLITQSDSGSSSWLLQHSRDGDTFCVGTQICVFCGGERDQLKEAYDCEVEGEGYTITNIKKNYKCKSEKCGLYFHQQLGCVCSSNTERIWCKQAPCSSGWMLEIEPPPQPVSTPGFSRLRPSSPFNQPYHTYSTEKTTRERAIERKTDRIPKTEKNKDRKNENKKQRSSSECNKHGAAPISHSSQKICTWLTLLLQQATKWSWQTLMQS